MPTEELGVEQRKGAVLSIAVVLLVLVLFMLILAAGHAIMDFGTKPLSVAYVVAVYIPVMALCYSAYRRLGTRRG
jgi:hypothetical protein